MPANLLIVDERVVDMMLNDRRFVQAIPCVVNAHGSMAKAVQECAPCQRGRGVPNREGIIKDCQQCLVNMPDEQKRQLKRLLDTEQVRIGIINGRGAQVWYTF
jgi:hypothetical protein